MSEFLYCLNTSTIRPTPLLDKIRLAGRLGYQAIEPWNDEIDYYLRAGGTIAELRAALDDAGLRVVSVIALHGWALAEGDEAVRVRDECARRMDQAAVLGSPFIVASPPREVVDLDQAAARFSGLLELGRRAGVAPAMEFLGFVDGVNTLADALAIASGTGDPEAKVVADVFHMIRGGGSVDDLLTLDGTQLACFHLNDVPGSPDPLTQTDADRVMLGEGTVDLGRVIGHLRTIGYRGPLSLELFNRELWDRDPVEVARTGIERMRRLVEGDD